MILLDSILFTRIAFTAPFSSHVLFSGRLLWQNICFFATTEILNIWCVYFVLLLLFNCRAIVCNYFFPFPSHVQILFYFSFSLFDFFSVRNGVFFRDLLNQQYDFLYSIEIFHRCKFVERIKFNLSDLDPWILLGEVFEAHVRPPWSLQISDRWKWEAVVKVR